MLDVEEKRYWIWFSLIKNLGVKRKQKLLEIYQTPKKIFELNKKELLKVKGIGEQIVDNILEKGLIERADKHVLYMEKNNIDIISIKDRNYPQNLRNIYDPPISLYVKGNKNILNNKGIAIIGCRDASEYGKKVAKYFGYNLSKNGTNIISGLAKGVDSYSHFGNLYVLLEKENLQKNNNSLNMNNSNNCGKPIAVVGTGLDIVYPKENKKLEEKIIQLGGSIISEYPLGTKVEKMNFPARNRIISGMSMGVLVVEAKEKSGTLITVDFALEQGRDVFVVPGNINSINSVGTNDLIKQGAKLVTNYKEIY